MDLGLLGWGPPFDALFDQSFAGKGYAPARITRKEKHLYYAVSGEGETIASVSGGYRHGIDKISDYPVVGDWVAVARDETQRDRSSIHGLVPRSTAFSRQAVTASGKERKVAEQVLAANVDVAILVAALDKGRGFNVRRIERYLTLTWNSGAQPVVVLNKADLAEDVDTALAQAKEVAQDTPVYAVSALHGQAIDSLRAHVSNGTTLVLLGPSGVGKSSLINRLAGEEIMRVGDVREFDARGRHTTTWSELTVLPSGGVLIDTPGLRDVQLWCDENSIDDTFREIVELASGCKFRDCAHGDEPGCAVREAVESGDLGEARLRSYNQQKREVAQHAQATGRWMRNTEGRVARRKKKR